MLPGDPLCNRKETKIPVSVCTFFEGVRRMLPYVPVCYASVTKFLILGS